MKIKSELKVFAPASVSNICCGFDVLGFPINGMGDEIIGRVSDKKELRITKITGAQGRLPKEATKNTAGVAAQAVLDLLGIKDFGIDLELRKKMPFGSGLGSSAASAVAGAMIINEMFNRPLTKKELLPCAIKGEMIASGSIHADNVAPSLLGGFTLIRDNATLDVHRVYSPKDLYVTVVYPHIQILTKEAREILSDTVPLKSVIKQTGNIAALILGLINSDFDLIGRSLEDAIIEPQRAQLIPHFYDIQAAAKKEGALGCSISGSGPTIFALSSNSLVAERVGEEMKRIFDAAKIRNKIIQSPINLEGAILC